MYADRRMALYAVGASAALPLAGPWALLLGPLLYGLLHVLTRLFKAFSAENGKVPYWLNTQELVMAGSPTGKERRKEGRRDEDKMPLARIKALEETAREQGRNLGRVLKKVDRHIEGCESAAEKNAQDNAKIIQTQGVHGGELTELNQKVAPMAEWHAARLKRAEFWARLADKITDKIMERVILALIILLASGLGGAKVAPYLEKLLSP